MTIAGLTALVGPLGCTLDDPPVADDRAAPTEDVRRIETIPDRSLEEITELLADYRAALEAGSAGLQSSLLQEIGEHLGPAAGPAFAQWDEVAPRLSDARATGATYLETALSGLNWAETYIHRDYYKAGNDNSCGEEAMEHLEEAAWYTYLATRRASAAENYGECDAAEQAGDRASHAVVMTTLAMDAIWASYTRDGGVDARTAYIFTLWSLPRLHIGMLYEGVCADQLC